MNQKPRISLHLANKLFNTPLAICGNYYSTMLGALQNRGLPVLALNDNGTVLGSDNLAARAERTAPRDSKPYQVFGGIAVISVSGSLVHKYGHLQPFSGMTGYDGIRAQLDMALVDNEVFAIALDIDSPGGQVAGCFALGDYIFSTVRGQKPIWALADELCASAAYALGASCDRLYLSETASVGSIGVICGHTDMSKALEQAGFKVTLFYSGKHKADGHPYAPISDELSAELGAEMKELHHYFASRVAQWRNIALAAVLETESRVYRGSKAVDIGLADGVLSADEFFSQLYQSAATGSASTQGVNAMTFPNPAAQAAAQAAANADITASTEQPAPNADATAPSKEVAVTGATLSDTIPNAARDERARIQGILALDAAASRPKLANKLAFGDYSVAQAQEILEAAAEETSPATSEGTLTQLMEEHAAEPLDDEPSAGGHSELDETLAIMEQLGK